MVKLSVVNSQGKETDTIDLPENVFGARVNAPLIHQAVVMYRAAQRQGTASTKDRGDVSGGGKKPFRQKGTGQARAGSNRSPLWHGGGTTFGPHPRDFGYSLSKKIRTGALRESVNSKLQTKNLLCIDELTVSPPKTKEFVKILSKLKLEGRILALLDKADANVEKASRNIPRFHLMRVQDVNALDVMSNKKLLVTKSALKSLLKRIQ